MRFTEEQIELCKRLKSLGLPWTPQVGHFVLDTVGLIEKPSPFQDRVYFILNYQYFITKVGGVDLFQETMLWLPTWHDARTSLRRFEYSDAHVAAYLEEKKSIQNGNEHSALLELLIDVLRQRQTD